MATKKKSTATKTKKVAAKKTASKSVSAKKTAKSPVVKSASQDNKYAGLNRWNVIIAVVLALQAIAIFLISKVVTLPVVTRYLTNDSLASDSAGHTVLAPAVRHLFDVDIRYLIVGFLLISALVHIVIATKRRNNYETELKSRVNHLRWIDYAGSAGLMLVLIAMLNGVYDIATLLAVFVLVVLLHFLAYFGEAKVTDAKNKLHTFAAVCTAGAAVWLVVGLYLKGAVVYGIGLSSFVYWIDGLIFVITLGLAYNLWQVYRAKGRWSDYIFGERVFMVLSFVAETALAWLVFAGFLK